MLRNHLTIMVVPQKDGRVFRFKISAFFLRIFIGAISLLFVVSIGLFIDYLLILEQKSRSMELDKNLVLQQFKIQEINNSLDQQHELLQKYEEFDRKLRLISGLQESSPVMPLRRKNGKSHEKQENLYANADFLLDKLEQLDLNVKMREVSFFQLEAYLQERKDRLARTPSIAPTRGHFSSPFGKRVDPFTGTTKFHNGVDWSNRPYTPIYAPADGVVVNTFYNGGYGEFLVIDHGYNIVTRYGHLAKYLVRVGQRVKRGDLIARIGNSGRSTAPHLHYEVLVRDQHVDPEKYILE